MLLPCIPKLELALRKNVRAKLKILAQREVIIVTRTKACCK